MINITITKSDNRITRIQATGHSEEDKTGLYDLLCNSVSVSIQQVVMAMMLFDYKHTLHSYENGRLDIEILEYNSIINVLVKICEYVLKELEEDYKSIKIKYIEL